MSNKNTSYKETAFLNIRFTQLLKGLACIFIVLHHYSQYIISHNLSDSIIYKILSSQAGYSGVALFFFLSGYGLMESEKKHHLTWKGFIVNRIWKIYKPILIINAITYPTYLILDILDFNSVKDTIITIFSIRILDGVLWFVYVLFFCYIIFYITTLFHNIYYRYSTIVIGYSLICIILSLYYPNYYSISIPLFFTGILVSDFKHWRRALMIILFIWPCLLPTILSHEKTWTHLFINLLQTILLIWFATRHPIRMQYQSFLGKVSYEVYLTHMKVFTIILACGSSISLWTYLPLVLVTGIGLYYLCNINKYITKIQLLRHE